MSVLEQDTRVQLNNSTQLVPAPNTNHGSPCLLQSSTLALTICQSPLNAGHYLQQQNFTFYFFVSGHPGLPEFLLPFRKPKRIRTAFSPSQLLKLEQAFEKNQYVVGQERKELAKSLNLSETQVNIIFSNAFKVSSFNFQN